MPHGPESRLSLAVFYALPSDQELGRRRRPVGVMAASAGDVLWQVKHVCSVLCKSCSIPLACLVPGASRQAHPLPVTRAGCRSSRHSDQKPVGLQPSGDSSHAIQCSPALQTRFRWSGGMMSWLLCPGVACQKMEAYCVQAARARSFQRTERFISWHIEQTFSRNRVFRSRLAHLMQYSGPSDGAELRIG